MIITATEVQDAIAADLVANPPKACKPLEGGLQIPLTLLTPSPLNPRKRWNAQRIAKMTESLRASGQVQPIRVRANPAYTPSNGREPYEIVVGETRFRAAPDAGLTMLDAVVGTYSDQQVIELALAENTQRQELHPLEEADAYDALLRKPNGLAGYATKDELAAQLGVSPSYVYQRLKLRNLCATGREAFLAGTIDASVALLIARMPDQAEQITATADILAGWGGEPYSYKQAAAHLKKKFMLSLHLAVFDTAATYSVAGPCAGCNKRSSAAPDLFVDVTGGDMCQDSRCYQAKVAEAHQLLLATAVAEGHKVVSGDAARKIMATPQSTPAGTWLRVDAPAPRLTDSNKPLSALLPRSAKLLLVDHPAAVGSPILLADEATATKALKAKGLLRDVAPKAQPAAPKVVLGAAAYETQTQMHAAFDAAQRADAAKVEPPTAGGGEGVKKGEQKRPKESAAQAARARELVLSEKFGQLMFAELHERITDAPELSTDALRVAVRRLFDHCSAEACTLLYVARGWRLPGGAPYPAQASYQEALALAGRQPEICGWSEDFARHLVKADSRTVGELLIELLAVEDLTDQFVSPKSLREATAYPDVLELAGEYQIDIDQVWARAQICAGATNQGSVSAPGCAQRELDATDAFVAAHATPPASTTTSNPN